MQNYVNIMHGSSLRQHRLMQECTPAKGLRITSSMVMADDPILRAVYESLIEDRDCSSIT